MGKINKTTEDAFWAEYQRSGSIQTSCRFAGLGWTQRMETYCLKYFVTGNASESARLAQYSPRTAAVIGRENLLKPQVQARLKELRQKAEDASISTVVERKKILSQIQRATIADFVDENGNLTIKDRDKLKTSAVAEIRTEETAAGIRTTLKLRDPVGAIAEHNKMEKIYSDAPVINNDNRVLNVIVRNPETADLMERISERTNNSATADIENQQGI